MQKSRYGGKTGRPSLDWLYRAPFEFRAASALVISISADVLDYVGAPIFASPVIGDIADAIVSGLLFSITRSKKALAINAIEFIPVIGDFIPAYTISTLMWIRQELSKRKMEQERADDALIIRAEPKMPFGKRRDEDIAVRPADNEETTTNYDDFHNIAGARSPGLEEEERMKRLLTSRYNRWKAGRR
jgi:hypothetical protein